MRPLPFVMAALGISAVAAQAQQTRTISSDGSMVSNTKNLPVAKVSYSDLKKSYKINPNITLSSVKADLQSNIGRALEITGKVSGVMATPQGKTAILNTAEGMAVIGIPDDVMGLELLNSGKSVRAMVLTGTGDNGAAAFTLIAATDNSVEESLFRSPYDDDLTVVPPSADVILPQPKMSTPRQPAGARIVPRPSTALPSRSDSGDGSYDSQKGAYKNLIRRFNNKLKDAQVDEIAVALLRAGDENRIDPRFLAAIIAVESDFDIYCLSSSGAMGLGQLMPFNLKECGITNAWNPTQNVIGMARLLRGHLNDYKDRPDGTLLAVAAYNAGPGAVRRAGYKVPQGQQVQRYVWKVYYRYKEFAPELFAGR